MGVLSSISNFFGFSQPQANEPDMADQLMTGALATASTAQAPAADNDNEISITKSALAELKRELMKQTVTRSGNPKARFPIGDIDISSDSLGGEFIGREDEKLPHGERVNVAITLSQPLTDYSKASLETAVRTVLSTKVPAFRGKLVGKPANDEVPTYQDVGKELVALLNERKANGEKDIFTQPELAVLENFFEAHVAKKDQPEREWNQAIEASHHDEKVIIRINASELPSDAKAEPKISSDSIITEFFDKEPNRSTIIDQFKKKALALGVVTEADLAHLDMHVGANGWNIAIHFANKPDPVIDPATQKPYAGEEYVNKMGATPLAKIDTTELGKLFTETLLESGLGNPIMARIMGPHMVADVLRKRAGNDPKVAAFLNQHDMFKSQQEVKAQKEQVITEHKIMLDHPQYFKAADGRTDEMRLNFELPLGMKLHEVLEGIVAEQGSHAARVQAQAANDNSMGIVA